MLLFHLKIFCLNFLVIQDYLTKKIRLISKFITSQLEKQTIEIHISPNISTSKDNQTMKFSQLIKYKRITTFLEKPHTKCGGETIPRPFSKKSKLSIFLDQQSKDLQFVFIVCHVEDYQNILKLSCITLHFTLHKAFFKTKEVWNQSPCLMFCMIFEEKYFSCYILLTCLILFYFLLLFSISLSSCLNFVIYWAIFAMPLC